MGISYGDEVECPYDFNTIFENHGLVRLIIDADTGEIAYANKAAVDYYGYSKDVLTKMKIQDINHLSPEAVQAERSLAFKEHRNYFVFQHQLASGETRTVEVYSYPMKDPHRNLLFSIVLDVTERVELEKSLQDSRKNTVIMSFIIFGLLLAFMGYLSISRENYRKKAYIDPLTGAYSRLYLDVLLEKAKNERRMHMDTCSIVGVDLDNFKYINDEYGHSVGDQVLMKVVEVFKNMSRDHDYVIRFGGDEFIIVLRHCDESDAAIKMKSMYDELYKDDAFDFAIEFSYGIQEITCGKDLYDAIKSADEKMYVVKKEKKTTKNSSEV